jgi:hypothetical protein
LQYLADHSDIATVDLQIALPQRLRNWKRWDPPLDENILMPHDGIAHTVSLIFHASKREDEISGDDSALKFEGQLGACHETADIWNRFQL